MKVWRRSGGWLAAAALFAAVAGPALAQAAPLAESCKSSVQTVACDPLPEAPEARRATLASLDLAARDAVAEHRLPDATSLFGCLLLVDPRPEHASNLAVAMKQSGDLEAALLAASCAEELSEGNPDALARARARREEIERLLISPSEPVTGPATATAPASVHPAQLAAPTVTAQAEGPPEGAARLPLAPPLTSVRRSSAPQDQPSGSAPPPTAEPSRSQASRNHLRHGSLLAGTLLLAAGATVAYLVARTRANQFQAEQRENGYTARAQSLRDSAQRWQAASIGELIGATVGGVGVALSW